MPYIVSERNWFTYLHNILNNHIWLCCHLVVLSNLLLFCPFIKEMDFILSLFVWRELFEIWCECPAIHHKGDMKQRCNLCNYFQKQASCCDSLNMYWTEIVFVLNLSCLGWSPILACSFPVTSSTGWFVMYLILLPLVLTLFMTSLIWTVHITDMDCSQHHWHGLFTT